MLVFDPTTRIDACNTLLDPFIAAYNDPSDEPAAKNKFDWSFGEDQRDLEAWKFMILSEALDFCFVEPAVESLAS
ncbi:MAP kinase SakA [Penicillium angulare]|uniref:MAP kinase SakA n=1 Tax=Penicillium angulare TaxID=116970 RepID=UPI00253FCDBB|nr:MAP kinase SakA [Penicillium angulare]KAJ5272568.1 MAP kinase SakA [Penicillium angulare]